MAPEYENIARSCLLLKGAPPAVAESVLGTARLREFDRGATIFLQGERASSIYIVADGWVKLYRISPNGAEAVVGVFTKGSSFGEAVALMNDTPYGLTAAVYSRDRDRAARILAQVNAGSVYWNCCDRVSPRLPWSGRGHSGVGSTLGRPGIRAFVQPRAWHLRTP